MGGGGGGGRQLFSLPDGVVHVLSVNVWDPGTEQDNPHSTEPCPPVIYIQSLTHVSPLKNIMQSSHGSTRWRPEGRQRGVWVHTDKGPSRSPVATHVLYCDEPHIYWIIEISMED